MQEKNLPIMYDKSYKKHNLLYYNKRYSNFNKHNLKFESYCSICNINLCEKCEEEEH